MPIEINKDDLDNIIPKLKRAYARAHDLTSVFLLGELQESSPQDNGRLAGSWTLVSQGNMMSKITTNVKYALVHDQGSDPYMIYPRVAQSLRFEIGGQVIFAKEVLHPGVQGTNYIGGSIAETNNRIKDFVETALDEEGL